VRVSILAGMLLFPVMCSAGDEVPFQDSLYGMTTGDYITYRCTPPQGGQLSCSFQRVEMRKERLAGAAEREERIAALQQEEASGRGLATIADCTMLPALLSGIRSGKPPEGIDRDRFVREFTGKTEAEMKDILEGMENLSRICARPTRENLARMVDIEEAHKRRTCRIFMIDFEVTFSRGSTANVWTSTSEPSGPCGEMTVKILDRDAKPGFANFWRFKTRNLVTNKTGLRCSDIQEREDVYEYEAHSIYRGCEYIKYGAF
jgi:hypothetical protein